MRVEPLYRVTFSTPGSWSVRLDGENGSEGQSFLIAEGRSIGRLSARYRAANFPRQRTDGTVTPDFRGVLETDDAATILIEWSGFARSGTNGVRELVGRMTHVTDDVRYSWLDDSSPSPGRSARRPVETGSTWSARWPSLCGSHSAGPTRTRQDRCPSNGPRPPSHPSQTVTRLPSSARCGLSTPTRSYQPPR